MIYIHVQDTIWNVKFSRNVAKRPNLQISDIIVISFHPLPLPMGHAITNTRHPIASHLHTCQHCT